jgi:hypothetical protein
MRSERFSRGQSCSDKPLAGLQWPQNASGTKTKKRDGDCPRRVPTFVLAGPGAESALLPSRNRLSGRSQRGDSAWCKTLDHLLSLLMEMVV